VLYHRIVRNGAVYHEYVDGSGVHTSWQFDDVRVILRVAGLSELEIEQKMDELQATGAIEFKFQSPYQDRPRLALAVSSKSR
jgi:hypothetical protein